METIVQLAVN